jgi:hypothetical protein
VLPVLGNALAAFLAGWVVACLTKKEALVGPILDKGFFRGFRNV